MERPRLRDGACGATSSGRLYWDVLQWFIQPPTFTLNPATQPKGSCVFVGPMYVQFGVLLFQTPLLYSMPENATWLDETPPTLSPASCVSVYHWASLSL